MIEDVSSLPPPFIDMVTHPNIVFQGEDELESAAEFCQVALDADPAAFEARNRLGEIRLRQGRVGEAIAHFEHALVLAPESADALCNLGNALAAQKRFDEALACYDGVLALQPQHGAALNNRGNVLYALGRYPDAVSSYDASVAVMPNDPAPYFNRGLVRFALLQHAESIVDFDAAILRCPEHAEALHARGNALRALRRYEDAAASYVEAVKRNPHVSYALGDAIHARMQLCDWSDYDSALQQLINDVDEGRPAAVPFILFSLSDDPVAQLRCATDYANRNHSVTPLEPVRTRSGRGCKIRLAYLSAKFHEHAGARLIAELLELHDKQHFETVGISFGPDVQGPMRARLQATFDEFVDVRILGDQEVASLLRERKVDIAIDLMGYQENARPNIFAYRAAPVQVSFLSWTGTMGARFIDYIIGDNVVIPSEYEQYYSERVVWLPDSYQVNDSKKVISPNTPAKADVGLPDEGFVFCCFNNNFKITPPIFDVWMRLLKKVDASVLWLLSVTASAERNLRREARSRGVDPVRLVFAQRMPLPDHLARHRLADLFLDTTPCNAHVTASEALWAGLPVLTCMGRSFMSRVAGSLLTTLGIPELVTSSAGEYEARALELASNPRFMQELRERVVQGRSTAPLFNTDRFRRHIEAAYAKMWEIQQRGEKPKSFAVGTLCD
jgi:predicted O-linked N-acetylglucosamine transferase (SPINDLY family)